MSVPEHPSQQELQSAQLGFDHIFSNELEEAKTILSDQDSAFHLLGLGVCTFLQAALGMEKELMTEASRLLTLSETTSRRMRGSAKSVPGQRFPAGLEYDVLNADAVILLGLTSALSESYMGYLNCMYSLNSAHSKFTKLYKTVYPTGLDGLQTPADTPIDTPAESPTGSPSPSRKSSSTTLRKMALGMTVQDDSKSSKSSGGSSASGFFGRWGASTFSLTSSRASSPPPPPLPDGPVEELIMSGSAFGFGLFNLVFSLLPKRIQSVVGFLGFKHDRKLALRALAVSAAKKDVHGVFSGLVLMTYHGLVLLLTGYQADERHILKQYRAIVDSIDSRYPDGALWILNTAKILRMAYDAEGAISVLEAGLRPGRTHTFPQADTLLAFELGWTYLSQRQYKEAAETFLSIVKLNQWSHATYYYIAAGCYISLGDLKRAQELLDEVPNLIENKKFNGKELPTEVFIKKRLVFYKEKQMSLKGTEEMFVEAIKLSLADEIAIFWNTHTRISKDIAQAHIEEWEALTPAPFSSSTELSHSADLVDLTSVEELASRSLLLGIVHRTVGNYTKSRQYLDHAHSLQSQLIVNTWVPGIALFEAAVCDLREMDSEMSSPASTPDVERWHAVLDEAETTLDKALSLTHNVDLGTRLDSRIALQKDEIERKRDMITGA